MTGRGLGPCGGGMRRGFSRGFGRGFGRRCPAKFAVGFSKEEEKRFLEAELKELDAEKETVQARLKEMK
jgi:hypothetical protein